MATSSIDVEASVGEVFAVLADGWAYSSWVVGASHMRAVEPNWPEVGSRIFHAVGAWPLMRRDETEVEDMRPEQMLTLTARGRPLGEARIVLELTPRDAGGCRVTMDEVPVAGPGKWLPSALLEAVLRRRNDESLARLAALVERRTSPAK